MSGYETQYGAGISTASPGSSRAMNKLYKLCLAPVETKISWRNRHVVDFCQFRRDGGAQWQDAADLGVYCRPSCSANLALPLPM